MGLKEFSQDIWHIKDILIVVLTPIVLIPLIVVYREPEAKCAYCIIILAIFWITEALPIAVTSLLPVFLFPMIGLLSGKETSSRYMNDTIMLILGGFVVAVAIEHWNIHRRIALRVMLIVGAEIRWIMFGLMLSSWFLSMWITNTATTAMMTPIANAMLLQLRDTKKRFEKGVSNPALDLNEVNMTNLTEKEATETDEVNDKVYTVEMEGSEPKDENRPCVVTTEEKTYDVSDNDGDPDFGRMGKCLTLCIAYSANVGGIASLTGTAPNLVMKGQLDIVYEKYGISKTPVSFASWMGFGVPLSFSLLIIIWIWLQILFLRCNDCCKRRDKDTSRRVTAVVRTEYEKLGPVSFGQAAVMGHFLVLAVLWVTRDMGGEYGWGSIFQKGYVRDGAPAMFIATLLFIFPSNVPRIFCLRPKGIRGRFKPLLSWRDAVEKVPWGVILLLGGGFAMAFAAQESGLSTWIGDKLVFLDYLAPWTLNLVLCYIVAAMTEVTSNTATCTLMMPILANLAVQLKLNPMYMMFPTALSTSFAFMLPVATPPNAIAFSYGYVRVKDMIVAGFVLNILCVLALVGFTESLGNHLFNFHSIPSEIINYNDTVGR